MTSLYRTRFVGACLLLLAVVSVSAQGAAFSEDPKIRTMILGEKPPVPAKCSQPKASVVVVEDVAVSAARLGGATLPYVVRSLETLLGDSGCYAVDADRGQKLTVVVTRLTELPGPPMIIQGRTVGSQRSIEVSVSLRLGGNGPAAEASGSGRALVIPTLTGPALITTTGGPVPVDSLPPGAEYQAALERALQDGLNKLVAADR